VGCFCAFLLLDTLGFGARVRVRLEISSGGGVGCVPRLCNPMFSVCVFLSLVSGPVLSRSVDILGREMGAMVRVHFFSPLLCPPKGPWRHKT